MSKLSTCCLVAALIFLSPYALDKAEANILDFVCEAAPQICEKASKALGKVGHHVKQYIEERLADYAIPPISANLTDDGDNGQLKLYNMRTRNFQLPVFDYGFRNGNATFAVKGGNADVNGTWNLIINKLILAINKVGGFNMTMQNMTVALDGSFKRGDNDVPEYINRKCIAQVEKLKLHTQKKGLLGNVISMARHFISDLAKEKVEATICQNLVSLINEALRRMPKVMSSAILALIGSGTRHNN